MKCDDHIIFFDGVCYLCNGFVQFLLKIDQKELLKFSTLQSALFKKISDEYDLDCNDIDTVVYICKGNVYTKSTACLKILRTCGFPWTFAMVFMIVPLVMRDWIYNIVANYRYKWFGKNHECIRPTMDIKHRFLEMD